MVNICGWECQAHTWIQENWCTAHVWTFLEDHADQNYEIESVGYRTNIQHICTCISSSKYFVWMSEKQEPWFRMNFEHHHHQRRSAWCKTIWWAGMPGSDTDPGAEPMSVGMKRWGWAHTWVPVVSRVKSKVAHARPKKGNQKVSQMVPRTNIPSCQFCNLSINHNLSRTKHRAITLCCLG